MEEKKRSDCFKIDAGIEGGRPVNTLSTFRKDYKSKRVY